MRDPDANANADAYANTNQHLWHCFVLLESESSPGAGCDANPHW